MDLGTKIRQARLEKGLSQKTLSGDRITRNMLSLIENGSAAPSMETLRYLAHQLGKPISFFLEDDLPANQKCILSARELPPQEALEALKSYEAPDALLDPEYYLLIATSTLALARQAAEDGKKGYCKELLQQAQEAIQKTPYCTAALTRERVLISFLLEPDRAKGLLSQLPEDEACQLRSAAYLQEDRPQECLNVLTGQSGKLTDFLRAEAYFSKKDYVSALKHYKMLPEDSQPYHKMELCCRELKDYAQAYHYACLQR